ncbi:hypothetical protein [Flavobacterium sp.]|uniref:hypothetical protein n=1 Tax=Flavobacterium sp. TaxID=239 RepID=UPI0026041952|nr:hypothetical protein [Flavobacterium sp.]
MLNNYFHRINVASEAFEDELLEALNKRAVAFSVKWSQGGPIKFHKINWKVKGGTWNSAITHTFNSTSGNELFPIGNFDPGTSISVSCEIEAFYDIPQAVAMLVQNNPGTVLMRDPLSGLKALTNGERWKILMNVTIK